MSERVAPRRHCFPAMLYRGTVPALVTAGNVVTTVQINKGGPTPRKPLGDANQNTGALVPAAAAVKPSPASASRGRRTPAKRAAGTAGPAPPPPAPPLPPRGSLLPGESSASGQGNRLESTWNV